MKLLKQKMETIRENYNWIQCRSQQILESLAPMDTSTSQILHLWLRENHRRGVGKIIRAIIPGNLLEMTAQTRSEQWQYQRPCYCGVGVSQASTPDQELQAIKTAGRKN